MDVAVVVVAVVVVGGGGGDGGGGGGGGGGAAVCWFVFADVKVVVAVAAVCVHNSWKLYATVFLNYYYLCPSRQNIFIAAF